MSNPSPVPISSEFIIKINIRDKKSGSIVSTIETISYQGLLHLAHDNGLRRISTTLVQIPLAENDMTAIVTAEIETERGIFTGIGDANPTNVGNRIRPHIIRMAETRAKARAFRDAVNVGMVAMEELGPNGTLSDNGADNAQPDPKATEGQLRFIDRLLKERGVSNERILRHLNEVIKIESLEQLSRQQASSMIDELKETRG